VEVRLLFSHQQEAARLLDLYTHTGIAMNLDEEVRLYTTSSEREKTENQATLYSIIVSLEYLERAYVRDSVTGKEYVLCYRG
jgi:ESCRT-I complex subunit VPS28